MIHIMFSSSAAGTLRQVLRNRGIREKVIDLTDNLDWGPIAVDCLDDREDWLDRNAPLDLPKADIGDLASKWDWLASGEMRFRKAVEANADRLIWIAPRCATEQAGLYWYLDRFGGEGVQMIVADYPLQGVWNGEVPPRLGVLDVDQIAVLLDECPRIPWDAGLFPADRWRQLVAENALVRVLKDGVLESAPDDFYDRFLLAHCSENWTKSVRVIGRAMGSIWDAGHDADSFLLTWRLRELIQTGELECEGELPQIGGGSEQASRIRRIR